MKTYFGCDAHKHYSIFASVDETGASGPFVRVENERSLFRQHLRTMPPRIRDRRGDRRKLVLDDR